MKQLVSFNLRRLIAWTFTFSVVVPSVVRSTSSKVEVSATSNEDAKLPCNFPSNDEDSHIEHLVWSKRIGNDNKYVYYYDPPTYNIPYPDYKGRAFLDKDDSSSLILKPVTLYDEGIYECRGIERNGTIAEGVLATPRIHIGLVSLTVNVPPNSISLSTFPSSTKNLTLTCRSSRSKPKAEITWEVYEQSGKVLNLQSSKMVIESTGDNLVDTIGYLYRTIKSADKGTTVQCVVYHPETRTVLIRNVTLVSPSLRHHVAMEFDWLGGTVDYASYESSQPDMSSEVKYVPGLIQMQVAPAKAVKVNTSVVVTISAEGAFPEPSYTWRSENLPTTTGKHWRIDSIEKRRTVFCLVENPVGRAVMSIDITVATNDPTEGTKPPQTVSAIAAGGGIIAAIAFGALVFIFLFAFIIYYFAFKRPINKTESAGGMITGTDDFVNKEKSSFDESVPKSDMRASHHGQIVSTTETDSLLKTAPDSPPPPFGHHSRSSTPIKRPSDSCSTQSSTTTTSGYSDRVNTGYHANCYDEPNPEGKERAITKHLQDFDENASFVGDYGSTFGLDTTVSPSLVEEARLSPFGQPNSGREGHFSAGGASSVDSEASDNQGDYAMPHDESWKQIDPGRIVHTPV